MIDSTYKVSEYEDESPEFKEGLKAGLAVALSTVEDYRRELRKDGLFNEAMWVLVAHEHILDELYALTGEDE